MAERKIIELMSYKRRKDKSFITSPNSIKNTKRTIQMIKTQENDNLFCKLTKELSINYGHDYTLQEIDQIAEKILKIYGVYDKEGSIPIIKIIKEFGFIAYQKELKSRKSGDIYINSNANMAVGCDKIIIVNKRDTLQHQRFVLAHELAHYLFDYIGNPQYQNASLAFNQPYLRNCHMSISEKRANRFAAALLMPEKSFIKQYQYIKNITDNQIFAIKYLSKFFETTEDSIRRRIAEVIK